MKELPGTNRPTVDFWGDAAPGVPEHLSSRAGVIYAAIQRLLVDGDAALNPAPYVCFEPAGHVGAISLDGKFKLDVIAAMLDEEFGWEMMGDNTLNISTLHREYSQAVDDEQGMRLIGNAYNESDIASVGIADTPGAYLVSRWVTDWERDTQ